MREYSAAQTQESLEIVVAKKHSFSYIIYGLVFITIVIPLLFSKFYFLGILLIAFISMRILALLNTKWTLTKDYLLIKGGFLPWKRIHFEIPIHDIYESYFSQSIFGKLFGYASITVRRTDGVSTAFYETRLKNYKLLVEELNQTVRDLKNKNAGYTHNTQININGDLDLIKLAELYEKELITKEEFIEFKQKLIK